MAERPGRDQDGREAGFDWLYGGQHGSEDATSRPGLADPDPTRRLPTINRPERRAEGAAGGAPYQAPAPSRRDGRAAGPGRPGGGPGRPIAPYPGQAPAQPAGRPPGRTRRRRSPWRWLKLVLVLWLVFLLAVPLIVWRKVDRVDASPSDDRPSAQPGTTYLLVGSDSRAGLTRKQELDLGTGRAAGRRTDSIMLLHTGSGPNLLMSIPRDSIVPIPGHGTTKINAAFAFGGPRLLVRTIEQNTGIRVDDYVEIGFAGFVTVVDAVGGVRICPKQAMKDAQANLDIKKGCQDVDGKVALGYARSRHVSGLGDIARAQHQREVVSAVGKKAASPWSILNPVRYLRLNLAASRSVRVGEDTGLLATGRFAWAMTHVNGANGLTCGVPISDLAVHWDKARAKKLFDLIAEDRTDDVSRQLCRASGLSRG